MCTMDTLRFTMNEPQADAELKYKVFLIQIQTFVLMEI